MPLRSVMESHIGSSRHSDTDRSLLWHTLSDHRREFRHTDSREVRCSRRPLVQQWLLVA